MLGKSLSSLAGRDTAPGQGGTANLNIAVDAEVFGGPELNRALRQLGEKEAGRVVRRVYRRELREMERTAKSFVAVDKGHTREQIQNQLKRGKLGELLGVVGVGLRGSSKGPKARKNLAAIIEFGRRSFDMRIKGRNGRKYSVRIPAVPGQQFLTRAARAHLPNFQKQLFANLVTETMKSLRRAENRAKAGKRVA
jgi:hypothetical protein